MPNNLLLRQLRAALALPFMVTVVIPSLIFYNLELQWRLPALPTPLVVFLPVLALCLFTIGFGLLLWTNMLFYHQGRGTLAPWDPPKHFVVHGPYRHCRNPMISGVIFILFAEAAATASPFLLAWALFFWCANAIYLPLIEEPGLYKRFGEEYTRYKENVPRWLPRLRPWQG